MMCERVEKPRAPRFHTACVFLAVAALPAQSERTPVAAGEATAADVDPALVADVQRELSASDLAVVAHGACRAAERKLAATVPALRAALMHQRACATTEQKLCAMALLDALVRTRADVPPEEVAPFLRTCTSTALVLLAQNPEGGGGVLLDFFAACGRGSSVEWLAAGGLLLRVGSAGFAPALVEHLHLDLDVRVVDDGRFFGHDFTTVCGNGLPVPESFPPIATYVLREGRAAHGELLAGDPFPVSYRRMLIRGGVGLPSSAVLETPQDRARVTWLEVLAGMQPGAMKIETTTELRIEWRDARDFERRVARAREAIETPWLGLRGELVRQKLLARDDPRGATPCVRVTVRDERSHADPPLPAIAGAELQPRKR